MVKTRAVEGDITKIDADAIIAPINPDGAWFGGIDNAIKSVSGEQFHAQAQAVLMARGLNDLDTVIARRAKLPRKAEAFDDVIFVVDALESPLEKVVLEALESADRAGYSKVSVPAIRTGVLAAYEKDAPGGLCKGIKAFTKKAVNVKEINVVVYNNQELLDKIRSCIEPGEKRKKMNACR